MLEIEDKYEVPAGFEVPPLDGLPDVTEVAQPRTEELEAVYFDTADLRLVRSKITLRRRTGGADAGWHLKLPAAADRREIQRPLGRSQQVPKELRELVFGQTRGAALLPVARLQTVRITRELRDAHGAALAMVVDDEVRAEASNIANGQTQTYGDPVAWREVEVELAAGNGSLLGQIGERLQRAGAQPSGRPSKLATVLGARITSAPPLLPELGGPATPASPAGDVIRSYLVTQFEKMLSADIRVRLDEDEGVHDMRVATRRLRSTMGSFEQLLNGPRAIDLEQRLKDLAAELGVVRDAEVLLDRLLGELDGQPEELILGPVRDRLNETLRGEVLRGRESLMRTLTSRAYAQLVDDIADFVTTGVLQDGPATKKASSVLPNMVARRYRKLARRAKRAESLLGAERALALHDTRKAAKQVRYAAEAVAAAFGSDATTFAKLAEEIQETLGEHQDSVVAAQQLREFAIAANAADGESAFTFGLLAGLEQAHGDRARDSFDEIWSRASRKRYRRWLH